MTKIELRELFEWRGRINRKEFFKLYLKLCLFICVSSISVDLILPSIENLMEEGGGLGFLLGVGIWTTYLAGSICAVYFSMTAIIRRFHDLNLTGWFSILLFIPLINVILYYALLFVRGSMGENKFGPDPLNLKKQNTAKKEFAQPKPKPKLYSRY